MLHLGELGTLARHCFKLRASVQCDRINAGSGRMSEMTNSRKKLTQVLLPVRAISLI